MAVETLEDLDVLVLRCRDKRSQSYVAESVAAYRAGAFRSAIVTCWIAVVFDFLHKLRDLDMSGDRKARAVLEEFEKCQRDGDVRGSLDFERKVLDRARGEFDLLSPLEHQDLTRLFDDRNRCAHPSMSAGDEVYNPPAELARLHIRNAVTHLLQHPPVQGQAALDRLRTEVMSEYFPTKVPEAVAHFKHGPLVRPRDVLVRNFSVANLKHLLSKDLEPASAPRFAAALSATRELHRKQAESAIEEKLSEAMRQAFREGREVAGLRFIHLVPDVWQFIADDVCATLRRYVEAMPEDDLGEMIHVALDQSALVEAAVKRLGSVTTDQFESVLEQRLRAELVEPALGLYFKSTSFGTANRRAKSILTPLIPYFNADHVRRLVAIAEEDSDIRGSYGFPTLLRRIASAQIMPTEELAELVREHGFESHVPALVPTDSVDEASSPESQET